MTETIVLGGGCFWCTEAVFQRVRGVLSVTPGYTGGKTANPTYEEVCRGDTGHVEVIKVEFDPGIISLEQLMDIFWETHDPTSRDRQGSDVGEQYRSAVFYTSPEQKEVVEKSKENFVEKVHLEKPVITTIDPLIEFYQAEMYHNDYFNQHKQQLYCSLVITPKIRHFKEKFSALLEK